MNKLIYVFVPVILLFVGLLIFMPVRMITMVKKSVKIGEINIHTESFGDIADPAFLLISGAGASARFWTDSFCKQLSKLGYFVIRFDNRDTGLSSGIDFENKPYALSDLTDDAIKILDAYHIEKAHVVGHSMGGYIAQDIALRYPRRVNSIIVISAGPIGIIEGVDLTLTSNEQAILDKCWKEMLKNKPTQNFDESLDGFMGVWKYLNGNFELDYDLAREYTSDIYFRSKHRVGVAKSHVQVMEQVYKEMKKRSHDLALIQVPTLIIHGSKDPLAVPRIAKELSKAIKNSRFVLVENMGHMIFNRGLEEILAKEISCFVGNL